MVVPGFKYIDRSLWSDYKKGTAKKQYRDESQPHYVIGITVGAQGFFRKTPEPLATVVAFTVVLLHIQDFNLHRTANRAHVMSPPSDTHPFLFNSFPGNRTGVAGFPEKMKSFLAYCP